MTNTQFAFEQGFIKRAMEHGLSEKQARHLQPIHWAFENQVDPAFKHEMPMEALKHTQEAAAVHDSQGAVTDEAVKHQHLMRLLEEAGIGGGIGAGLGAGAGALLGNKEKPGSRTNSALLGGLLGGGLGAGAGALYNHKFGSEKQAGWIDDAKALAAQGGQKLQQGADAIHDLPLLQQLNGVGNSFSSELGSVGAGGGMGGGLGALLGGGVGAVGGGALGALSGSKEKPGSRTHNALIGALLGGGAGAVGGGAIGGSAGGLYGLDKGMHSYADPVAAQLQDPKTRQMMQDALAVITRGSTTINGVTQ